MYTALYCPQTDLPNPSCDGFKTIEQTEKYIQKHWCNICRKEYAKYLRKIRSGDKEVEYPILSCDAEWLIIKTKKLNKCQTLSDIFTACGYEKIKINS